MKENVAGALCYLLGWITGIVFFMIDKRPFVRFHAAQSVVVFGGLQIISIALGAFAGGPLFVRGLPGISGLFTLVSLIGFALWIVLMVKALQGERFRVPLAADIAEQLFVKR